MINYLPTEFYAYSIYSTLFKHFHILKGQAKYYNTCVLMSVHKLIQYAYETHIK